MNKQSYLSKSFKKISLSINSLIIKNSKKLNLKEKKDKISQFATTKRVFIAIIVLLVLSYSYLSLPILYNKSKLQGEIKNQLLKRYNVDLSFSSDMKYNLFPRPNFTFDNVQILRDNAILAIVKEFRINLEINNFFSVKNLEIKDVFLKYARFDIYKKDLNFFIDLLNNDFSKSEIIILNSYVFVKDNEDEVLLINKINEMEYLYDNKKSQNILNIENEIFNIPYFIELYDDKDEKKFFSKIKINILKSIFETTYYYTENNKRGEIDINKNKNKSKINFNFKDKKLIFNYEDKMKETNFDHKGIIYLKPFFLDISGKINKIDVSSLSDPNSVLLQFLKTDIFNNQNLNVSLNIKTDKILPYQKLVDLLLNLKIKEGLIDIDDSKVSWSNYADFEISESLIYVNNNNLTLDGKLNVEIKNYNEIYKFFQTPRNYRKEVENINFDFSYNFDQEMIDISNIEIDNQKNLKVGDILSRLVSQENVLQNRIYLKNLINRAIKAYAG